MIKVPTQLSELAGNFVRTYALSQFPSWRPFAYRFESRASLLSNSLFIDKPLDIHTKISKLKFVCEGGELGEIREEAYSVSNSFYVKDLVEQSNFMVSGEGSMLSRALNPTSLTVYYLFQKGLTTEEGNRNLVGLDENMVVFASRHTVIDDLGFSIKEIDEGVSQVDFYGCDAQLIQTALTEVSQIFLTI